MLRHLVPLLLVLGGAVTLPVQAQRWIFNPVVDLSANYDDNLTYAGAGDSSDTGSSIRVQLPVRRAWKTGSFSATYTPSYTQYRDFKALDRDEHRLRMGLFTQPNRTTALQFGMAYTLTQDQGNPADAGSSIDAGGSGDQVFLSERTERAVYGTDIRLTRNAGPTWVWSAGLGATIQDNTSLGTVIPDPTDVNRSEDRENYRASFSLARKLSETRSFGFRINQRRTELDLSGDEDASQFGLTYSHMPGRNLTLDYQFGAFYASGSAAAAAGANSRAGLQLRFNLQRDYRDTRLEFWANHRPTSGGNERGTSTNSSVGLSYSGDVRGRWRWELSTILSERNPADPLFATLRNYSVRAEISRKLWRVISLQLMTRLNEQTSDNPTTPDTTALGVRLGIIWHPLGRTPLGGSG